MKILRKTCISILMTLVMCACDTAIKSPPHALPMYPNANDIQRSVVDERQEILFHTDDTPSAVLSYYEYILVQQRWTLVGKFPDLRTFVYTTDRSEGYSLSVFIIDVRDGKTYVSILQRGVNPSIIPIDEK